MCDYHLPFPAYGAQILNSSIYYIIHLKIEEYKPYENEFWKFDYFRNVPLLLGFCNCVNIMIRPIKDATLINCNKFPNIQKEK